MYYFIYNVHIYVSLYSEIVNTVYEIFVSYRVEFLGSYVRFVARCQGSEGLFYI